MLLTPSCLRALINHLSNLNLENSTSLDESLLYQCLEPLRKEYRRTAGPCGATMTPQSDYVGNVPINYVMANRAGGVKPMVVTKPKPSNISLKDLGL